LDYTERVSRSEALQQTVAWQRANLPAQIDAAFDYTAEGALLESLKQRRA
jgi:phage FluMu gp28-like protein